MEQVNPTNMTVTRHKLKFMSKDLTSVLLAALQNACGKCIKHVM